MDSTVLTDAIWARTGNILSGRATAPGVTLADDPRSVKAMLCRPDGIALARSAGALTTGVRPGQIRMAAPNRGVLRGNREVSGGRGTLRQLGHELRGGISSRGEHGGDIMIVH